MLHISPRCSVRLLGIYLGIEERGQCLILFLFSECYPHNRKRKMNFVDLYFRVCVEIKRRLKKQDATLEVNNVEFCNGYTWQILEMSMPLSSPWMTYEQKGTGTLSHAQCSSLPPSFYQPSCLIVTIRSNLDCAKCKQYCVLNFSPVWLIRL